MKHLQYILYIICLFLYSAATYANQVDSAQIVIQRDSLKLLLERTFLPSVRMERLCTLSRFYHDETSERDYLLQLYTEAEKLDSINYKEYAASTLTRYYYNKNLIDSVIYWNEQVKQIATDRGSYSDIYFTTCNLACQFILWYDVNEEGANEALRLYHLAQYEKNKTGAFSSCETMGVAYTLMGQDSIAIKYYEEGIQLVQTTQPLQYGTLQSMIESTLESAFKLGKKNLIEKYLHQYETLTEDIANGKYQYKKYPIDRCRWLVECFRIEYNLLNNNLEGASFYLDKAWEYYQKVDDLYAKYRFHLTCVHYYKAQKEYATALAHMDEVLKLGDSTELFTLKGEILEEVGRYEEASECYKKAVRKTKEKADASFMRQMNQLAHLHDISTETQAHNEEILRRKQWQLILLLSSVCFVIVLLLISVIYTIGVRRMRNKLRTERDKLIDSEYNLSIAKNKAEESDRLKSIFLANMSHEIRTPLNAIVGFSQLICNPETDISNEEKLQFSNLITNNTELLLNLINDILDISKLEANSYKFTFKKCNISECFRTCISSVQHRVAPNVKLTFTTPDANYHLTTDKLRLEQVLINLLTNAAKFTTQGEINLTYEADADNEYIRFIVTDTGCGIPLEKQDIIFSRFEKLDNYIQGTGLGLTICSLIVKQFGGTITVDKTYTKGAKFIFTHQTKLKDKQQQ